MLIQRVNQIALGYEDANDCDSLWSDPVFKLSCDELPLSGMSLASQSTMSRFENSCSRTTLYRMSQAFLEAFIDSYAEPPEGIIIDFDDTVGLTHGAQQMSIFNSYHNTTCYMPLHVYEGQSGKLITTILRPGKRPSGMENYIKEHKLHLFSGRTSCHTFEANQFRLFLHSAAYFLLQAFRRIHLKYTEFFNAQFDTIRLKLLKIGAQVRELKTRVKIHLPSSFPLHNVFITIWKSCCISGYT